MKSITVSVDDNLIDQAQALALARETTLDQMFRDWLATLVGAQAHKTELTAMFRRLDYVQSGGPFTREQMNER